MSFEKISFKNFILNENIELLGDKIGLIYTSVTNLQNDFKDLGPKMTSKELDKIVSDIKTIIKGHLATDNKKHMETLRDLGVAISKELDPKNDKKNGTENLLDSVEGGLKGILEKLGVPINDLGVPPEDDSTGLSSNKDNTTKPKDLEINPAVQPVSGFDSSAVPPIGSAPEQQNPNSI